MRESNIEGRLVILGNLNAQSPDCNMYCGKRLNVMGLERLVDTDYLILNNKP